MIWLIVYLTGFVFTWTLCMAGGRGPFTHPYEEPK